jgi:hypothetical protein
MPFTRLAIEALFERLVPSIAGVSRKRLQNARRDCVTVMERYGLARRRLRMRLSPTVETFAQSFSKFERLGLGQLLVYLSVQGIDPTAMNDAVAHEFRSWLETNGLKNADVTWRRCLTAWNKAGANLGVKLTIPRRRVIWGLPWSAFPASLQREVNEFFEQRMEREG